MHSHIAWDFFIGIISQYWFCIFINQSHISNVFKQVFNQAFNQGHQLGSSTRVINQDLQLGSSTRVINWGRQLGFHQLVFISQVFTTLTTLTVFTRSSQGFKKVLYRDCYPMIGPHVHMGPIKIGKHGKKMTMAGYHKKNFKVFRIFFRGPELIFDQYQLKNQF